MKSAWTMLGLTLLVACLAAAPARAGDTARLRVGESSAAADCASLPSVLVHRPLCGSQCINRP